MKLAPFPRWPRFWLFLTGVYCGAALLALTLFLHQGHPRLREVVLLGNLAVIFAVITGYETRRSTKLELPRERR